MDCGASVHPHNCAQEKAALYGFSYHNVSPKETEAQITSDTQAWLHTLYRDCVIGVEAVSWGEVKRVKAAPVLCKQGLSFQMRLFSERIFSLPAGNLPGFRPKAI